LGPGLQTAICSRRFRLSAIYIFFYPLACHVWALGSERLSRVESIIRPCGLARPSRRYSFSLAASPPHGDIPSALRPKSMFYSPHGECRFFFSPPHGDIPSALRPKLMFYLPHGECQFYFSHAPSRRNRFSIRLTANADLFFLTPPHGKIDFLFASRRM